MNPLNLLESPLRGLLNFLHDNAHLTYGWSIVVLTVIVRTILLPLVIKQYKSMRAMQLVAPQLKELQRKHKGDRTKLNEELMAFYKENEINPFASCLPLVAQIPVFISLYYVLKAFAHNAALSGGSVSFMWIVPDVRQQLQDIGWGAAVIVAIYALSQLLSTELSATPNMPDSQRRIMRILPLVIVIFVFQFPVPSGLVIYWLTTNLWTCGQQLVMRHRIGLHLADPEEVARYGARNEKRGSRTPSTAEVAAAAAVAERPAGTTPRRRRRRGAAEVAEAPEPEPASQAPEPSPAVEEPSASGAPEGEALVTGEGEPTPADEAAGPEEPAEVPSGGNGRAGDAPRRQPRPKGAAKGSRPAQSSRAKRRKR